ncbi:MAG: ABC transporter permease [Chloroflexi bacterium]|nr:ABC transporter permease [Chloroflexota bacterium]MYE40297.1 ABC transporter permease [Chloroflexota bacterium]
MASIESTQNRDVANIALGRWPIFWRGLRRFSRRSPLGLIAIAIILFLILMAIVGPFVAPYDPLELGAAEKFSNPGWGENLLGGDNFGRDVLSRILHGAWRSLVVGVIASVAGTLVGGILGLVSAYYGGRTDAIMQRFVDILMAFPVIILALALLTALDRSMNTLIVAIAVPFIPYGARVVRASTLVLKETQYVEAARAIGASDIRVILRHIAPGCFAPYIVVATGLVGVAIITESALGFLGLGIPPPTPTWGEMLSNALTNLLFAPYLAVTPGVFITLAVFSFSVLGDSLRDVLDPRLRGRT